MNSQCVQCGQPVAVTNGHESISNYCEECSSQEFKLDETQSLARLPESDTAPLSRSQVESGPQPKSESFGDYELLDEIARGGMGVVYRARQRSLNRIVAVKMIQTGDQPDQKQVDRFQVEAQTAGQLNHPGIVTVYEAGTHRGKPFISMEFVEGENLADVTRNQMLTSDEVARIMSQVATAVQCAHDRKIVHRDLKPQNILIDENSVPHVTDFGLAKNVMTNTELTVAGQILGTPAYMSPEQAIGDPAGVESDIWSIGATLYYLLTGRAPFQSASAVETLRLIVESEPVAPRRLNPAIPVDLETICLKALQKEATKRYRSASEFADDLQRFLSGEPVRARRINSATKLLMWCRRNKRLTAAVLTIATVVIASAILFISIKHSHGLQIALQKEQTDKQRAVDLVQNLVTAPSPAIPYAVESLRPLEDYAIPLLKSKIDDEMADSKERSHAAIALAELKSPNIVFLVNRIRESDTDEFPLLISALRIQSTEAINHIKSAITQADKERDWRHRARLALASLELGEVTFADEMCRQSSDPTQRSIFIDECSRFPLPVENVLDLVNEQGHDNLKSAVCLLAGSISNNLMTEKQRKVAAEVFTNWYVNQPDPGIHSATEWTLTKWNVPRPSIKSTELKGDDGPDWFVNSVGMTLHRIPAGKLVVNESPIGGIPRALMVRKDFYIARSEVKLKTFLEFLNDKNLSPRDRARRLNSENWKIDEAFSATEDHPVQFISFQPAAKFCNWLSRKENLKAVYQFDDKGELVSSPVTESREGYRLPTPDEWLFAARAGAKTKFSFGDNANLIHSYSVVLENRTEVPGSRLPNVWGLFDMHGNLWEHTLKFGVKTPALMGGSYYHGEDWCQLTRSRNDGGGFNLYDGFRVARNAFVPNDAEIAELDRKEKEYFAKKEAEAARQKQQKFNPAFYLIQTGDQTQVSEDGAKDTFSVRLGKKPDGLVTLYMATGDEGEAVLDKKELIFTTDNWDQPQIVTVTGVDDDLLDGAQQVDLFISLKSETNPKKFAPRSFFKIVNLDND